MPLPVSLHAVAEKMQEGSDESFAHIHRTTGELFTILQEEIDIVERDKPRDELADWQQEMVQQTERVLASDDFLPLPTQYEIHEYDIMERFCESITDERVADDLLRRIRGSGAFRRFKDGVLRHGIADQWYQFRDRALESIAAKWLEMHEIPYTRP